MQQTFQLFVCHHHSGGYTASILTHPRYAVYGHKLSEMKRELHDVMAKELALGNLVAPEPTDFPHLRHKSLRVEVRGIQNHRLITVPMRFTVAHTLLHEELYEVRIPRLGETFQIVGSENIDTWAEEIIRGRFHLHDVKELVRYQYEKNERFEPFPVTWHGAGRYKEKPFDPFKELEKLFGDDVVGGSFGSPLETIGVNLTEEARKKQLPRAFFREEEVQKLRKALSGKHGQSTLLLGMPGVGKTAVLYELLPQLISEQAPPRLADAPVWHISGGRMVAGMKYLGQWQERCQQIAREIVASRGILYVDSLLELLMTGGDRSGLSIANFFLPYIRNGELTLLAETTPAGLTIAERINAPFVRALRKLSIPALPTEDAFRVLQRAAKSLEREHKVVFSNEVISSALDVIARFGDLRSLPGTGITLLEQIARTRPASTDLHRLQPVDAIRAFSRSSGFPEDLINPGAKLEPKDVQEFFCDRVRGQEHAMTLLTNLVLLIKASLNDPEKPLASFLFMGPTGVGKTEAALTLAEYLFQDRKRLLRLDMSEFSYPGSGTRLVGGADGQGELTKRVREQPFSILLLDELEKADPSVFDVLLQVLGEGRLTDQTGQTVSFRHCIVIMTSNLGAARKKAPGFGDNSQQQLDQHYKDAAETHFRPEFINRIDNLVPFHDLTRDVVREIAEGMLKKALQREGFVRRGIQVRYEPEVLELLVDVGFEPKYGARPLKRAIERYILIPISRRLVQRTDQTREIFDLVCQDGQVVVYSDRGLRFGPAPVPSPSVFQHDHFWKRYLGEVRQRMLDWQESPLFRALLETEKSKLPSALQERERELRALEEETGSKPSLLSEEKRAKLAEQTYTFASQWYRLEWELTTLSIPARDSLELCVASPSSLPSALKRQRELVEIYQRWASAKGCEVEVREQPWSTTLRLQGQAAGLIAPEMGLHRWVGEEDEEVVEIHVRSGEEESEAAPPLVREYRSAPATIWDPRTKEEFRGSLEELVDDKRPMPLERFLLARWMRKSGSSGEKEEDTSGASGSND